MRSRHAFDRLLLGWLLAVSLSGCGLLSGADGGPAGDGGPGRDGSPPPPSFIQVVKSGEKANLEFATGGEQYVLVPYSSSETAAEAIDFTLAVEGGAGGGGVLPLRWQRSPKAASAMPIAWQRRLAVEAWRRGLVDQLIQSGHLRGIADRLAAQAGAAPRLRRPATCQLSSECGANQVCAGGPAQGECKGRLIVKTSEFSGTAQASARVAYRGTRTTILVDEADTVAESDIAELGAKADGIIHPREVALFGDPKISVGGRELASSDRNGDGLVWLMLTSKVREKQAVGFFVPTDFDDQSRASNVADILYLAPPADQNPLASTLGTLAHELQHLLNFAAKVYRPAVEGRQAAAEALWLDEGQAHFAEDATGFGVDNVTLLDQELFPTFGQSRLTETDSANDSLRMRAAAYTFVRYLFERKGGVSYGQDPGQITDQGGAALLKALHGSDQQGVANVNASYGPFGGDSGAFLGWLEIMVLDHRGVSSDGRYNFAPLRHDPATGFQTGLLLRGERKGEGGKLVKLGGPLESPIDAGSTSDAIPNAAGKLFLLSGLRGAATAKVSAEDSGFGLLLVRVHE